MGQDAMVTAAPRRSFAVFQKCNGRGPGRGTDMFPARTGDRKGSLLVGVTTGPRINLRITGGHR